MESERLVRFLDVHSSLNLAPYFVKPPRADDGVAGVERMERVVQRVFFRRATPLKLAVLVEQMCRGEVDNTFTRNSQSSKIY